MIVYLGYLATILTTIAFLPQVIKSHKAKKLDEISLLTFVLFTAGVLLWLAYGLAITNYPIIVANFITSLLAGCILYLKLKRG